MDGGLTPEALGEALRQRLAPQRWPLPLEALPGDAVLVGGAVRDAALGRLEEKPDLDLVVAADAIALARRLARRQGGSCVVLDGQRDMARLVLRGWTIDLARREGADLDTDLRRRDYTVNAIALPLATGQGVVDPNGGLEHLRQQALVAVSEANLLADPLRLLRGVRLAADLEFTIREPSLGWIRRHAARLEAVAGERVLAELEKLAMAPSGQAGLAQAWELGLLAPWGARPAAGITAAQLSVEAAQRQGLSAGELAEALPLARLAWLLDGQAAARLNSSRRLQQRCQCLRHWGQRLAAEGLDGLPESERLNLHEQLERDLPALLLGQPPAVAQQALSRWREPTDPLFHPHPPLDGRQLQQALQLTPGPRLGQLLNHLKGERAFGRLADSPTEGVLEAARRWLEDQGAEAPTGGVINCPVQKA